MKKLIWWVVVGAIAIALAPIAASDAASAPDIPIHTSSTWISR